MKHAAATLAVLALCAGAAAVAQDPAPGPREDDFETIEVEGSRAELRKRIETFVLADYLAMSGLSKVDLTADLGQAATILRLFAADPGQREPGITEWDRAFLRGLYRQSYSAVQQRSAIASRMVRELAPRAEN
jgi:uncharacterized caspase-like protein